MEDSNSKPLGQDAEDANEGNPTPQPNEGTEPSAAAEPAANADQQAAPEPEAGASQEQSEAAPEAHSAYMPGAAAAAEETAPSPSAEASSLPEREGQGEAAYMPGQANPELDKIANKADAVRTEIEKVIIGQSKLVDLLLVALLQAVTPCWKAFPALPKRSPPSRWRARSTPSLPASSLRPT